jgi:hypothetical protein
MKPDDELKARLRAWSVDPQLPDSFQRAVWQRIAVRQSGRKRLVSGWLEEALSVLLQPRYAAAIGGLMLATSLGLAHLQAQQVNSEHWRVLEARYTASINPEVMSWIER